jgi:hypothetical protein
LSLDQKQFLMQAMFYTAYCASVQEIIVSCPTAHLTGTHAIQTGDGTFFDIFANRSFFIDAGSYYDA